MRGVLLASSCAVLLLTGCASDRSLTRTDAPSTPAPVVKTPAGQSNRFNMTQNGKRMTAGDFDAWMKARGYRIAKGPQRAKSQAKAQAQAKPKPKARTAASSGSTSRASR